MNPRLRRATSARNISEASMPKTFYLTTAIDYTNGAPHNRSRLREGARRCHRALPSTERRGSFLPHRRRSTRPRRSRSRLRMLACRRSSSSMRSRRNSSRFGKNSMCATMVWAATTDPLPQEMCARNARAPLRRKANLQGQTGGLLQCPPGTVPDRQRAWPGRRVRPGVGRRSRHREEENYYFNSAITKNGSSIILSPKEAAIASHPTSARPNSSTLSRN